MKILTLGLTIFSLILSGCAESGNHIYHQESGGVVCGEFSDGTKQTFPSIEELSKVSDTSYLHDGPCYDY